MLAFIGMARWSCFFVVASAVIVVPFWRIFAKAGFPGALALLMLVPVANLIMLFILAFMEWPALRGKSGG
jgi:hypothetical protein